MRIPSGTTNRHIYFVAVDATDLKTRETGLSSFTVYYEIANGTATAMTTPTVTESDQTNMPGVYTLLIDESAMTTLTTGHDTAELCVHITQAAMAPVTRVVEIYRAKITEGQTATAAAGVIDANAVSIDGSVTAADRLQRAAEAIVFCTFGRASTTTSIVTSAMDPAAAVADQFKGRIVIFDNDTTTANLRGQATDITASTAGGVLTVTALTTAPVSGDTFTIN